MTSTPLLCSARALLVAALLTDPAAAQTAPSDSAAIVATVRRYIAAMSVRDTAYLRAASLPTMATVGISDATGEVSVRTLDQFLVGTANSPGVFSGEIWSPEVSIDGPIARLRAPYVSRLDGVVRQCGTDHYMMVWSGGRWLASQMVFTRRTVGCDAPR